MANVNQRDPGGLPSTPPPPQAPPLTDHLRVRHRERDRNVQRLEMKEMSPEAWARKQAKEQRDFYAHLATYAGVMVLLFIIDVLSGEGWWFFWPLLGWGIGVVAHAVTVFGENRFGPAWEERKTQQLLERVTTAPASPVRNTDGSANPTLRKLIDQGVADVARLRSNALRMADPDVRTQALRICTRADDILAVLSEPGRDELLAREFVDQVLTPARTVFANYVRLSERQIASAEPALRRVETHDLPYIEQTLSDLHERLHRNDVITLEVASEMLTLGRAIDLDEETETRGR
jgi:hypothetical protein